MAAAAPREVLLCETQLGPLLVFAADQVIGRSIATSGQFQEGKIAEVFALLATRLGAKPRCFVDIGANIGTHLLFALDSGLVERGIAVEADPRNFSLLSANVGLRGQSGRTRLFQCALSDVQGSVQLELSESNYGDHRVRVGGRLQERDLGESTRVTFEVPAWRADDLFRREGADLRDALVWMDTQGHEGQILAGAERAFGTEALAVVMEFWPYGLDRAGGKERYFDFLRQAGAIYDINRPEWPEQGRVEVPELLALYDSMLADTRLDHYPHTDLLCLPARTAPPHPTTATMNAQMDELQRSLMTIGCRDTDPIPKVAGAGGITMAGEQLVQLMHNGLKVVYGGYYGEWMAHVIRGLGGHHEPQEELVFHHLLRYVRHRTRIVELGAFWSYYSLWYLQTIPGSLAVCIEPDANHQQVGILNAALNQLSERVTFHAAWIGGEHRPSHVAPTETMGPRELPLLNAPAVLELAGGPVEVLHLDIQGAELSLLRSIDAALASRLRFVMVSTHHSSISGSKTMHADCVETLRSLGATILVEHDVVESFSGDGLILASFMACDRNLRFPEISRNRAETSLFASA